MLLIGFIWDTGNIGHIALHAISVGEAEHVILNATNALDARLSNGELRMRFLGQTAEGRILVVVATERDHAIRVVTAFPANRTMRRVFQQQKES